MESTVDHIISIPQKVRRDIKWQSPYPRLLAWINFHLNIDKYVIQRESNYMHYKMWDEITYPFPNFQVCTVEVW